MDLITYNTIKNKKNVVNNYVSYYPYYYCPTPIQKEKTTAVKPCSITHNYSYPYNYYYPYGYYHPYFPMPQPIKPKQRPFTTTIISAYDIAVKNGFEGTEQEWLSSLIPSIGENGHWFINNIDTGLIATLDKNIDYNDLINKPTLNGQLLQGDINLENISEEFINDLFAEKINQNN